MPPRLVAFDFDGTLTDAETIVSLANEWGVAEEVAAITERAMAGELSYAQSLRQRVQLLRGLDYAAIDRATETVQLRSGVAETIEALRANDIYVAVITGAFRRVLERRFAADGLIVDTVVANELVMQAGHLTGDVTGPLIEGAKDRALSRYALSIGVDLQETAAVGDGANDIPMLRLAGIAIGFEPRPIVQEHCDYVIKSIPEVLTVLDISH